MNKTNPVKIIRAGIAALLIPVLFIVLTGAAFFESEVMLDTKEHAIYQHADIGDITGAAGSGRNGGCYALTGTVGEKNKNNRKFDLVSDTSGVASVSCTVSDEELINEVSRLTPGDRVTVYGRLNIGLLKNIGLEAYSIKKTESIKVNKDLYSVKNGPDIDIRDLEERSIGEGRVSYRIPKSWRAVEHDIKAEKLGEMEGYQYRLNEIGRKSEYAESFFVCYFDTDQFVAKNDRDNFKAIEEAILRDIMGKDDLNHFPAKRATTYYGAKYKYYLDTYTKPLSGDKYQVEFVFRESGEDIIVYLYIYNTQHINRSSLDEIMLTMRLTDIH